MASSLFACVCFLLLIASRPTTAGGGRTNSKTAGSRSAAAPTPAYVVYPPTLPRWNGRADHRRHTSSSSLRERPSPAGGNSALGLPKERTVGDVAAGIGGGVFVGWRCRGCHDHGGYGSGVRVGGFTRLQVSASLADRRGKTGAGGRGGKDGAGTTKSAAGADLSTAPVETIENIDRYFEVLADNANAIVVVKVFAGFCRACKAFDRKYRQLAIDYSDAGANIKFYDMDWAENRDLCKSLQVKKLPHIELYAGKRGRLESFVCGPSKAGLLAEKLDALLRDPLDPSFGAAAGVPPTGALGSKEFTDIRDVEAPDRADL